MLESELRAILRTTPIPRDGHKSGTECRVLFIPEQDFVVKYPTEGMNLRGFDRTLLGYERALAHLGGSIPRLSVVRNLDMIAETPGEDQPNHPFSEDITIVQELRPCFLDFRYQHDLGPRALATKLAERDIEILNAGCYRVEVQEEDYGVDPSLGRVELLDCGTVCRGDSTGWQGMEDYNNERFLAGRGEHLYQRYWRFKQERSASFLDAYVGACGLTFLELDPNVDVEPFRRVFADMQQTVNASPHLVAMAMNILSDSSLMDGALQTFALRQRYSGEFIEIAQQEKGLYYREGAQGRPAEPFITG